MKNMFKYTATATATAIVLGLMGSTAAMAAPSGTQIGTGTVQLHGNVTNATCTINWKNTDSTFNIDLTTLKTAKFGAELAKVNQSFVIGACNNTPVAFSLSAINPDSSVNGALVDGVVAAESPFFFTSSFSDPAGIVWSASNKPYTSNSVIDMDGKVWVNLVPASDDMTYTMTNNIMAGHGASSAEAKVYNMTYTYNATYK